MQWNEPGSQTRLSRFHICTWREAQVNLRVQRPHARSHCSQPLLILGTKHMDKKRARTSTSAWSWQTIAAWFVPPVVIPGFLVVAFAAYLLYQAIST